MKMITPKNLAILGITLATLATAPAFAAAKGGDSGGGGDAEEARVNEIRSDILSWIQKGGARELTLPADISQGEYEDKMTVILEKQKVAIAFTNELVKVKGLEKTCRGSFVVEKGLFGGQKKSSPQILCNLYRFKNTKEADQYPLIHHEYAGLVNIEKNDGAASDYEISNQITDFLETKTIKRLAVKKKPEPKPVVDSSLTEDVVKSVSTFKKEESLAECRPLNDQLEKDHIQKVNESIQIMVEGILSIYTERNKLAEFEKVDLIKTTTTRSSDAKITTIKSEYLATTGEDTIPLTLLHTIEGVYKKEYSGRIVNFVDKLGRLKRKELHCHLNFGFEVNYDIFYPYSDSYRAAKPKHMATISNSETNHRLNVESVFNDYLDIAYGTTASIVKEIK